MVSRPLKRTDSLVVYGKSSFCGKGVYSLHFKTLDSPGKHFILFDCCRKAANMLICCKMLMMTISFERVDLSTALCAYIIIITGDLCDSAVCLKCFYLLPLLGALSWAARGVHRVCGESRGCHHRNVQLPPTHQVQRVCRQREYFLKSGRWPLRSDRITECLSHGVKQLENELYAVSMGGCVKVCFNVFWMDRVGAVRPVLWWPSHSELICTGSSATWLFITSVSTPACPLPPLSLCTCCCLGSSGSRGDA